VDSLYLFVLSLWLFAPLAVLLILLRATRRLVADYGQLRYLVVAIVPLAVMLAIAFMFPEPSDSERHLTRVGFFVGIPTFVYMLLSQMFFIGRGLLGLVR
jgi:hypothetical protein